MFVCLFFYCLFLDCGKTFWGADVDAHTSCISEAEKYQGSLFKQKNNNNNNNNKNNNNNNNKNNNKNNNNNNNNNSNDKSKKRSIESTEQKEEQPEQQEKKKSKTESKQSETSDKPSESKDADADASVDLLAVFKEMSDFKWKKTLSQVVGDKSSMSLKELEDAAMAAFNAQFDSQLRAIVRAKAQSSKKIVVQGDKVTLKKKK